MSDGAPTTMTHNVYATDGGGSNRDSGIGALVPAVMAMGMGKHHDGFGGAAVGAGALGFIAGALIGGGRRGGIFGGGDEGGGGAGALNNVDNTIYNTAVLSKLGAIEAQIPASACATQAAIATVGSNLTTTTLQQTIALQSDLAQIALGAQQGFANVKDSVQVGNAALFAALTTVNQNVLTQGCETRAAVANDGDKTRAMLFSRFQLEDSTRIGELNARLVEAQSENRRAADTSGIRIDMINTQVQAQQQLQAQQQQQQLLNAFGSINATLAGLVQIAHATNGNVIAGNTGAVTTGAQTANPINVA